MFKVPSPQYPLIRFDPSADKILSLDLTKNNTDLTEEMVADTELFSQYINRTLQQSNAKFAVGGYDEHRTVYSRSKVFDAAGESEEPRRLHLGLDIWGAAGTPVYAPLDGVIHSFAFNDQYGDYGATIIVSHPSPNGSFHSLYGHLSLKDLDGLFEGKPVHAGEEIAHFGEPQENGHWPPHLHFQLIIDMEDKKGDYPGVCKFSERTSYLSNCPDPGVLAGMMK